MRSFHGLSRSVAVMMLSTNESYLNQSWTPSAVQDHDLWKTVGYPQDAKSSEQAPQH